MKQQHVRVGIMALALVGVATGIAEARKGVRIKQDLSSTGVDPDARGQVRVQVNTLANGMRGKLDVKVGRLDRKATYEIVLAGVRVGTLTTTGGGNGKARFSTQPRRRDQLLGTDPRGMDVQVRNAAGNNVLETTVHQDGMDPTHIRCCLPHGAHDDDGEQPECEDRTPEECMTAGGTDLGPGSCLPNPCEGATPPPPEAHVVCCVPDDDGAECEDHSPAKCSEKHGVSLGEGTCVPNPCGATVPQDPATIQCCLSEADDEESEVECEDRTPEVCAAQGGTNMGHGTCHPNPCAQTPEAESIRCCLPHGTEQPECESRTAEQCAAQGGTNLGAGSCDPNPCAAAPQPEPDDEIRCCTPHHGDEEDEGPECELRTAAQCVERGGTNLGPGSCDPNPCQ